MQSNMYSASWVHDLKRAIRAHSPQIKNTHVLEALARGFRFDTWAALNTALDNASADTPVSGLFTPGLARDRLVELGYPPIIARASVDAALSLTGQGGAPVFGEHSFRLLKALATGGLFTADQHATIRRLAEGEHTIVIAGLTGTGKSTLLRAILEVQAHRYPGRRIALFQDALEFKDYPDNVMPCLPERHWSGLVGLKMYRTVAQTEVRESNYDTVCLDDIRQPGPTAMMLKKWRASGYGVATVHATPGTCLTRVGFVLTPPRAHYTRFIDACIYMENRKGKPAVHSIEVFKGSR